jgi:glycosyltransferase involved in cell wall biosynthesis
MRIGVDARLLTNSLTGIGRYTLELSKKLIKSPVEDYFFYAPSAIKPEIVKELQPSFIRCGSSDSRISKMIWSQANLPLWALKDSVDLFWGPTHRLPRYLTNSVARVVTIHDLVWKFAPKTMRPLNLYLEKKLMPEAIELADIVVADSSNTKNDIQAVFPKMAHKVRIVNLGIPNLPEPDKNLSLTLLGINNPYFLFVGTIEPRKNLVRLIKAFAMIPRVWINKFMLVIVGGSGWGNIDLYKLINKYNLQDSVVIMGYVSDAQLSMLYLNARFLAMPSLYEGFGLPLVEAMHFGVPVLTSSVSSLPEIAGNAGLIVDPESPESISNAIYELLTNDDLLRRLKINAREQSSKFSWGKCANEMLMAFYEAIELRNFRISKIK